MFCHMKLSVMSVILQYSVIFLHNHQALQFLSSLALPPSLISHAVCKSVSTPEPPSASTGCWCGWGPDECWVNRAQKETEMEREEKMTDFWTRLFRWQIRCSSRLTLLYDVVHWFTWTQKCWSSYSLPSSVIKLHACVWGEAEVWSIDH